MVQASAPFENRTPFKNRPKSTIRKPDMSGFWIPTVHESVMSIYTDKLAHVQIVINCRYFVAQSAPEKTYWPAILGAPS